MSPRKIFYNATAKVMGIEALGGRDLTTVMQLISNNREGLTPESAAEYLRESIHYPDRRESWTNFRIRKGYKPGKPSMARALEEFGVDNDMDKASAYSAKTHHKDADVRDIAEWVSQPIPRPRFSDWLNNKNKGNK